jgi:hypothetical protein
MRRVTRMRWARLRGSPRWCGGVRLALASRTETSMTSEEFEAAYAEHSGVTVAFLHDHGRFAKPCSCGDRECEGWAMGRREEERA